LLVEALLEQLPEDNNNTVISVKHENIPQPAPINGHEAGQQPLEYDPSVNFLLEVSTRLALKSEAAVEAFGKQVFDVLQGILRDSSQWHAITVSRATFYSLSILRSSYVRLHDHEVEGRYKLIFDTGL
jgi:brefeldin A-resistance guanine nucleotide exchange factor 1